MAVTRYGQLRNDLMRRSHPTVFAPAVLRDADSSYVPIPISERLVQCIWYDQRVRRDDLRAADGRVVRVVFPGWWNLEAGPDFRHATVQIADEPERTGDVEVHLRADDWIHHGHERDPLYNNVVLHVVLWEPDKPVVVRTRAGDELPQVVLQHQLSASLESLYDEVDLDAYPHNAEGHAGRCAEVLRALPPATIAAILDSAGDERFAAKTRKFTRWIHRAHAEQAFYEGWMEALGYKANKTAFRALARQAPLAEVRAHRKNLAAVLFGVANFLPTGAPNSRDAAGQQYVKRLWNAWWKLRPDFDERALSAELWRFRGIRPANHPHRRLGAAVALLKKHDDLLEKTIGAIESDGEPAKLFANIRDDYWSRHFTLGGKTQPRQTELIGAARAEEIVANVVLPFAAAYAQVRDDGKLLDQVRARYATLSGAASNAALRLASQQLFESPSAARRAIRTARQQQGLLQIFQDFCLNDKSACRQCQFPELARRWTAGG